VDEYRERFLTEAEVGWNEVRLEFGRKHAEDFLRACLSERRMTVTATLAELAYKVLERYDGAVMRIPTLEETAMYE